MSDRLVTEAESSTVFADYLGIQKRLSSRGTRYVGSELLDQRAMAVACALELIKTAVAQGGYLDAHLTQLGVYADQIQDALNKA